MPSIVGPVKINSAFSGGQVIFGDVLNVSTETDSKTYTGSGSASTGDFQVSTRWVSSTDTIDPDGTDGANIANN